MFFIWFDKNRHFRLRSNLSGQIFPILVICLAGLMVAVVITIGVGEGAKAKTYASNAADACSLATASCWAGSFNKLVAMNKDLEPPPSVGNWGEFMGYSTDPDNTYHYYKTMYNYYYDFEQLEMRSLYKLIYEQANKYLTETPNDNARYWIRQAINVVTQAKTANEAAIVNCQSWNNLPGANLNILAAEGVWKAAKCIGAFYVLTVYMQKITDFFKKYQLENFSNATLFMDEAYDRAVKTGEYYAFSNSGTSFLLTSSQGDDFDFWLATGNFFVADSPNATFTWGLPGHQCSITVTVDLPTIASYGIKHTKWNYPKDHSLNSVAFPCANIPVTLFEDDPFNIAAALNLRKNLYDGEVLATVYKYLTTTLPQFGLAIHDKTVEGVTCCEKDHHHCVPNPEYCDPMPVPLPIYPYEGWNCEPEECDDYIDLCPNAVGNFFDPARVMQTNLIDSQICVIDGLKLISGDTASTGLVTIPTLKKWNDDIFDNVWTLPGSADLDSVANAEEARTYIDESEYPGMMIINIDSVTLSGAWQTKCTVTTSCEDGGSTTSTSTSKFDGGNLGAFEDDYFAEIISTS